MKKIENIFVNGQAVSEFPGKIITKGAETIYSNTDMDNYIGTIEFDYAGQHVILGDGCEFPVFDAPVLAPPSGPQYVKWISHFLKDGDFDGIPEYIPSHYWRLGPKPDLNETHSTGSSRIYPTSCPGILAYYVENYRDGVEAFQYEEFLDTCIEWVQTQALRSDGKGEWSLEKYPDTMWGWGYGKAGGLSDLYGASNFLGRPEGKKSDGLNFVDYLHFQITPLIHCALLLRSQSAVRSAIGSIEVCYAYFKKGAFEAPRAWAGLIQAIAHMIGAGLGSREKWYKYLLDILMTLESKNVNFDGRVAPLLDYGKRADHMNVSAEMADYLSETLGVTDSEDQRNFARSWSTWMGGWFINAIIDVLELVPMPLDFYKRWNQQLKIALKATDLAFKPASGSLDWRLHEQKTQWIMDEYAPLHPFTKNAGHNTVVGVQVRFLLPALERAQSRGYEVQHLIDSILNYCDENQYWNSSDLFKVQLEHLWPTTGRRGFEI